MLPYRLRTIFVNRILGHEELSINRTQNRNLLGFVLQIERTKPVTKVKELLWNAIYEVQGQPKYKGMMVSVDVVPM